MKKNILKLGLSIFWPLVIILIPMGIKVLCEFQNKEIDMAYINILFLLFVCPTTLLTAIFYELNLKDFHLLEAKDEIIKVFILLIPLAELSFFTILGGLYFLK